jgi:thiol-disulfide isomerase/thioredoxin
VPDDDLAPSRRLRIGMLAALAAAIVLVGLLALGLDGDDEAGGAADAPRRQVPLPGSPGNGVAAPEFTVTLFDGTDFDLADHIANDGRPVLLNLWASWCPPCRAEMPHFNEAAPDHPGAVVLGVAVDDDPAAARAFAEEISIDYPIGADDGTVDAAFAPAGLPATYLIDGEGRLERIVFGQITRDQIEALLAGL